MNEIEKKAHFYKAKTIALILVIVGLIAGIIYFVATVKADQNYWANATYSFYNPISGKQSYYSGTEIGEYSFGEFIKSKYMNNETYVETAVIVVAMIVIAGVVYAFYNGQELELSKSRISGKAVLGKAVDLDYARIATIKKAAIKGVIITTIGQEKIKFRFVKNQSEIIEYIFSNIGK